MLLELTIKDFAIIERVTISFEGGLTVMTGETGAGKSIIIDAIGQLIGGRGSADFVRHASKRAEIEGIFSIEDPVNRELNALFEELDLPKIEEGTVLLRREITNQGKSICRINGKLTTLGILRQVGQTLVDIHGQHEHQRLLQQDQHVGFLDRFAGKPVEKAKKEYGVLYKQYMQKRKQLHQFSDNEQQLAQRLDLLQYQYNEISDADLSPGEDEELLEEKKLLENSEHLYNAVRGSYDALYGDGKGLEWVMTAMNQLSEAAEVDDKLASLNESVTNQYYLLEEASFSLRDYFETITFDSERLQVIEDRLSEIQQLKRKYGATVNDILEYASRVEEEIDALSNREQRIEEWQEEVAALRKDLILEGTHLHEQRKKAAGKLEKAIQTQLKELYMKDTVFDVKIDTGDLESGDEAITKEGIDKVSFQVATNKGEPLKSLAKIASGGEISRMILALKTILSKHEGVTSLIFDEVDTGVSGRVAQAIAEKIHRISGNSQVLCITHLPQVAAMADTHMFISKESKQNRTITRVEALSAKDKTEEISRMISGVEITDLTRQHANELIAQADRMKEE
ncbi:DNA repair protein RecN [Salisediminibacterium selenitireducens]|uniref:DNA repair protein RecN n=1 Tax=Bacillus selenitireducens (strain ATCC 700615 / DSM 15326 / MLS10) TaxID=439292 RepID=D6XVM7_BACIE|nr:DNA repair protein RecN [Salisediminibacterium selenitireducens]ADH99765.1 DNA repair protein RecN [[Bacillus] selenitireducens MLS10]